MDIASEIRESFKQGSSLTKLIYINLAVFLAVNIFNIILLLFPINFSLIKLLAVPASLEALIFKPWTIITYMFLHEGFIHLLFNMLVLFWFGKLFLEYLNQKQLLSVYFLGGISGAIMFILFYNIFPSFAVYRYVSIALGASASVMAVVFAISFYIPNRELHLMFIGPVKIKYIAYAYLFLDVISIAGNGGTIGSNAGGHIAHLGGALFGYFYILQLHKGRNIAKGFDKFADSVFTMFNRKTPKSKMKVKYRTSSTYTHSQEMEYNARKAANQEDINMILEKISKSGYDSLTSKEKEKLFKASK